MAQLSALLLLLHLSPFAALQLGMQVLHTPSGRSGVVTNVVACVENGLVSKVKVAFDGETLGEDSTVWAKQSPDNLFPSAAPEIYPPATSLQVEGVTLVPHEMAQCILEQWDAGDPAQHRLGATVRDIAHSVGVATPLARLVLRQNGRVLSSRARAAADRDDEFVRSFLARPQAVKVSASTPPPCLSAPSFPDPLPPPPSPTMAPLPLAKAYARSLNTSYAFVGRRLRGLVPRAERARRSKQTRDSIIQSAEAVTAVVAAFEASGGDLQAEAATLGGGGCNCTC